MLKNEEDSEGGGLEPPPGGFQRFQAALTEWFRLEGRDYPWRKTRDPYAILVSEAMLQQTQIATVLGRRYFQRWMCAFPDWLSLASASEKEVLKLWEGLGYYNRARNLRKTAITVINVFGGQFPERLEEMLTLPGVGRYTAGAVASFAFDQPAPIVDGNVARVLARVFAFGEEVDAPGGARFLWHAAERLTPKKEPRIYNSGVMELGQRICTRSDPKCTICPVKRHCRALKEGNVTEYPVKRKAAQTIRREENVILAINRKNEVLLCPEAGSRRKGLWRLPEISEESAADLDEFCRFDYAITRYHVTLTTFFASSLTPGSWEHDSGAEWFSLERERELPPVGSPYLKVLGIFADRMGSKGPQD